MNQKLIFIDEPKPHQALGEARTTMRNDILSRLLLEAGDFFDKIAAGNYCISPARCARRWLR